MNKKRYLFSIIAMIALILGISASSELVLTNDPYEKPCKEMCAKIYPAGSDDYHACVYCCTHECN